MTGSDMPPPDLPEFCARRLFVRSKGDGVVPLALNPAQRLLHERIEAQRAATGRVRTIVLKARQQGISTYVAARFFHRILAGSGQRCFILTHRQEATQALFEIVRRFHDRLPEDGRPALGAANARTLSFPDREGSYVVATAGARAAGRAQTIQLFHGSEVAHWPGAEAHAAGALQAVPDRPGSEAILESTANGVGGDFHARWQAAETGEAGWQAVFLPWFLTPEYRCETGADFRPTEVEAAEAALHGLDDGQILWARRKRAELRHGWLFAQEYPAVAAEAFRSGGGGFIPAALVLAARRRRLPPEDAPLIVGVDPARFGPDRTAIIRRRGRQVFGIEAHSRLDTMEVAGLVRRLIEAERPARVFIDVVGLGAGVVDRLVECGHGAVVRPVNGGERPGGTQSGGPVNRRAEMWSLMRDWLEAGGALPDDDALQADLCGARYAFDSLGRLKIERKEEMKRRGLRSPDLADALGLTFAEPVLPASALRPLRTEARWIV